jgi:hypothetical protein
MEDFSKLQDSEEFRITFHVIVPNSFHSVCIVGDIEELGCWNVPVEMKHIGMITTSLRSILNLKGKDTFQFQLPSIHKEKLRQDMVYHYYHEDISLNFYYFIINRCKLQDHFFKRI